MNQRRALLTLGLVGLLSWPAVPLYATEEHSSAAPLLAGVGQAEITPPVGTPLAGYSKRHGEPSTGIEHPLYARALVLRQGNVSAVIVSAELLIIDEPLYAAVAARVRDLLGADVGTLLLTATHTHSGPGAYGRHWLERISMGEYDPRVFDRLVAGIGAAVTQALEHAAPVEMGVGEATVDGAVRNRRDAAGVVDATLRVAAFREPGGPLRAVLVNFAAHPTTLSSKSFALSGDYPGVVMRTLETQWPGSVCLFTVSNLGDQGPVIADKTVPSMTAYGTSVAAAAARALASCDWRAAPELSAMDAPLVLPPARLRLGAVQLPRRVSRWLVGDHTAHISAVRLGDVVFIGYPGEPTASVGQRLTAHLAHAGLRAYLLALSGAYIGYIVSPDESTAGGYEAEMNFFGPSAGQLIEDAVARLVTPGTHAPAAP